MAEQHRTGVPDPVGRAVPDERRLRRLVRREGHLPLAVLRDLGWRYRMRCLNESLHLSDRTLMARAPATLAVRSPGIPRPEHP